MPVDMSTLLLMFPVVALSMALAILIVALGRWNDDGLAHWGSSLLMLALAFPLFVVHGHMVGLSPLLVVFGNVLLAGSYALALVAVCLFFGRPRPSWRALAPVGLAAAGSAVFIEQADVRVALGGVLFGVQGGMVVHEVLRRSNGVLERGRMLLAIGAAMVAVLYLQRSVGVMLGWREVAQWQTPHWIQVGSHLLGLAGLIFTTLGFVLMGKERADAEHQKLAQLDALTGVPNRRALMESLDRVLAQAVREQRPLALMMVDIDHFKRVNDSYGHLAGDAVLAAVASCLKGGLRAQDALGRYGGEEFLIVLPATDAPGAARLAEHLRQAIEKMVVLWAGQQIRVTISLGVHARAPAGRVQASTLIDTADQAMYAAKRAGRNRVEIQALSLPPGAPIAVD